MSINSEALQRKLYDLLDNKGYNPKPMDATGKVTPVPEEAAVIKFDFIKDGENYGKVWISIDGSKKLKIYYGDSVSDSPSDNTSGTPYSDSWTALLNHLKNWAQRRQLSFELRNENHLEADMAQRDHMDKKERISEGYYPMGKSASYSDAVPSVKIVIEHSRKIEEGEQRYRNINRIFVENAAGERFLLNTTKPGIARVYARHIAEGGTPYDERGQHIKALVEEYSKMAGFVRATKSGQFNESTQKLIAEGVNHYNSLRETLSRMSGKRGYEMYFESWTPALMEDDSDTTSINELFVQETVDPRIESAMPILAKLSKNIKEMAEVSELAEWADSLLEGGDGGEASEETDGDTAGDAGEGGAEDAPEDDLMEAPGAETLAHNQRTEAGNLKAFDLEEGDGGQEALNPIGIPEGRLDGSDEIDSPVANAITRRILLQRVDLLAKYGPEKVADAIANVADDLSDWIGPDDEIGSSDVSAWIKRVEGELGGVNEGYDRGEEYEDMSDSHLMQHARMLGLEKNIVPDGEGGLANRREVIRLLQAQAHDEDLEEGLDPEKKARLKDLIDAYSEATDPEYMGDVDYEDIIAQIRAEFGDRTADSVANGPSMHFPRPGHSMGYDDLEFRQMHKKMSPNRITKLGKLHKQDSDSMKRDIKSKLDVEEGLGDVAKKVGSALKTGAKAVGKAIVGKDDDELLRDLKKRAGVHNPQTGKPSMAQSDVEKVDEDLGPEQKKVGQLGPTEKVKNNNIGKLVGANESFINTVDQAVVSEMDKSEDKKGPEGKAKPITPKKMADDAKKVLDKKNVKEGQEDLEAILRIIRK